MTTTRDMLRQAAADHPDRSAADHARHLGVSRERVRQLARALGISLPRGLYVGTVARSAAQPRAQLITGGVPVDLNASTVGTVSEMLAAADLLARGYQVFFPLIRRTGACDLIAISRRGDEVQRIEVRSGHRRGDQIVWLRHDRRRADRCAIVLTGEPVRYDPPLDMEIAHDQP